MGQRERDNFSNGAKREKVGALGSMYLVDACCIAKAYVNAGIARGVQVRQSGSYRWFRNRFFSLVLYFSS